MSKSCPQTALPRAVGERGFSLVEVLVSIVVLSFGMLGMVGLQAAALQTTRDAKNQSTAVTMARELAEIMRSNKQTSIGTTANPYLGTFTSPLVALTPSYCMIAATTTPCPNPLSVANANMTEWLGRLDSELPGASVTVCLDATPFDAAGLPQWSCSNSGTTVVVKVGWTRAATKSGATGAAAFERASVPSVVFPVIPGSSL